MDYNKFFEGQVNFLALLGAGCIIALLAVNALFPNRYKGYDSSDELMFWDEPNPIILNEFSVYANAYSERYGFTRSDLTVRLAEGEEGLIWTWWDLEDGDGNIVQYHHCDSFVVNGSVLDLPVYDIYAYGECMYTFTPTIDEWGDVMYDADPTPYIINE